MQLLLIAEPSLSSRDNRQIGDVVGIFADDHVFSRAEQENFTIVRVDESRLGISLEAHAQAVQPEVRTAQRAKTADWTLDEPERRAVWQRDGAWLEVKVAPRLSLRWDAADERLEENYSRHAENLETTLIAASLDPVARG